MTENSKAPGWSDLFLSGCVVDLDIGLWSGRTQIRTQDFGIEDSKEVQRAFSLGSHRLFPKESFDEIREIARQAKRTVEWHSLPFPFVRGARYVPSDKLPALTDKLKKIREGFLGAVGIFVANYETAKIFMLPTLQRALKDAAHTPEAAQAALQRLQGEYPAPEAAKEKFRLSWSVYAISAPKDAASAEGIAAETEAVRSIVNSMVMELRTEFSKKVGKIAKVVARGGIIPEKMIESAVEVMGRVESMNVMGDEVLRQQVGILRGILTAAEANSRKTVGIPETTLTDIEKAIEESADEAVRAAEESLTSMGRRRIMPEPDGGVSRRVDRRDTGRPEHHFFQGLWRRLHGRSRHSGTHGDHNGIRESRIESIFKNEGICHPIV